MIGAVMHVKKVDMESANDVEFWRVGWDECNEPQHVHDARGCVYVGIRKLITNLRSG